MYGWGALSCPGDPGCPGYVAPEPISQFDLAEQQIADVWDYLWNTPGATVPPVPAAPAATQQSATQWLNDNAGKVALGVGGFFLLTMFAKAGR